MTTSIVGGPKTWEGERDEEGYRTFYVERRIKGAKTDGPSNVMNTSGLALPGAPWSYDGDADSNVWCTGEMKVTPEVRDGSPNEYWTTRQKYTNKPLKRCQTSSIENPLDEPDKVSGSFTKYTKEAVYDRFGDPIVNSAFEQMRGPQVERDANRPNVTIEKNLATLPLSTFSQMIDTVNDSTLWGLPARCVKLTNVSWSRKVYGTCSYYYTVSYEFDIDYDTFDRDLLDEGTKVLEENGDENDPRDFEVKTDTKGNPVRVILDGHGQPWTGFLGTSGTGSNSPGSIHVEFYGESNFLLLDIPTSF